jgi:hypothetical protein
MRLWVRNAAYCTPLAKLWKGKGVWHACRSNVGDCYWVLGTPTSSSVATAGPSMQSSLPVLSLPPSPPFLNSPSHPPTIPKSTFPLRPSHAAPPNLFCLSACRISACLSAAARRAPPSAVCVIRPVWTCGEGS